MKILLATDGSEGSDVAARFLARLPLVSPEVTCLAVAEWRPDPVTPDEDPDPEAGIREELEASVRAHAERAAAALDPSWVRAVETRSGEPARTIADMAERMGAELIVVGSHGRRGLSRFLLGSVSQTLAMRAPCSVLVARDARDPSRPLDVVVGIDGSRASAACVDRLRSMAQGGLGRVELVSVVLLVKLYRQDLLQRLSVAFQRKREKARRRLERAARILEEAGVAATVEAVVLEHEHAAEALLDRARETRAGLVMIGHADTLGIERVVLGSVANRVLSHADASVWVERGPHAGTDSAGERRGS